MKLYAKGRSFVLDDARYFTKTMMRFTRGCRRKFRKRHLFYLLCILMGTAFVQLQSRRILNNQEQATIDHQLSATIDGNKSSQSVNTDNTSNLVKSDNANVQNGTFDNILNTVNDLHGTSGLWNATNKTRAVVPSIFHLIWVGKDKPMTFVNYISILSAYKHQSPIAIILHYSHMPSGYWFEQLRGHIPKLKLRYYKLTKEISGHQITQIADQITVMALQILLRHGGIYMENDVIILRKLEPLRHHNVTIGECKTHTRISPAFIMAARNASFIQKWYNSYVQDYKPLQEGYNRAIFPRRLCDRYPRLVHMDKWRLTTPDSAGHLRLVQKHVDWDKLFVFHLMSRTFSYAFFTPDWIQRTNSTLAEVARLVYFGSTNIVPL